MENLKQSTHLFFNTAIGIQKPESIRNKNQSCPFCAREELAEIIDTEDSIILVKNKYPVLSDAFQTVLIETDQCDGDMSVYSKTHLIKLLKFAIRHWTKMDESEDYKSVILFKNHGPLSGGSIAHPHMQIVGLEKMDYMEKVQESDFEGLLIHETKDIEFNLSTKPRVGFYEFNIRMKEEIGIEEFASSLQTAVHYILKSFPFPCSSYNLFFYRLNSEIICKAVPRFITTPYFIGYSIPQVPSNLEWMTEEIKLRYYQI